MEALLPQADTAPAFRKYRNRPDPPSTRNLKLEAICDTIYVVDDDHQALDEITGFLAALHFKVIGCLSACECLNGIDQGTVACVILNMHLPDISGLELQKQLTARLNPPVVFIADRCDIASMVKAMKAGAMDFLTKPLDFSALAESVKSAFERGQRQSLRRASLARLQKRLSLLTPREREVLPLVVGGLLNKQAASLLGISEVTFQIHRSQVMRKMEAGSVAELVRMAIELRIPHWRQLS